MLKLKMERKMNKEKLDNLFVKVYKLTNNENGLNYRVIAREKRFGKIVHDKMFFTKEGVSNFINKHLSCTGIDTLNRRDKHREVMLKIKNAKDDKERDILMEQNYHPVYAGGCEGLLVKHKTNGLRIINYDFLDKIRYDEKNAPVTDKLEDNEEFAKLIKNRRDYNMEYDNYENEYGITKCNLINMIKDGFNNIDYKDVDNFIVRFKHKLYRH